LIPEPGKELIQNCQKRDMESFRMLYRHYEKFVFGFCLRMLNNQQDTEDAVQTVFLNLYHGIVNFKFNSRFTTYLMSITRNVCFDMLRQQKRRGEAPDLTEPVSREGTDYDHDLLQAISNLPSRTRECFILFAVEQYPQAEIAELLQIKIGTVKALIFQARQKLIYWLNEA